MKNEIGETKQEYMTLNVKGLYIQVKFEWEGVVIDVFDKDDEVIESSYCFYHELAIPKEQL